MGRMFAMPRTKRCRNMVVVLLVASSFFLSLLSMARFGIDTFRTEKRKATEDALRVEDKDSQPKSEGQQSTSRAMKTRPVRRKDTTSAAVNKIKVRTTKKIFTLPPYSPLWYKKDIPALKRYISYLAKDEDPLPKQTRAVIIVTNHRSGSSFFGELFNQHPDAFYLFEPLFPLSNSSECELRRDLKKKMLKEFVQCSLPDWRPIYKDIPLKEQNARRINMQDCLIKGMCFRPNTKGLCEDRHCPTTSARIKSCKNECGTVNRRLVDNECRRKSLVALKLIRVCDIRDMEDTVSTLPVDIKILHLLRDPRGITNSRLHILKRLNVNASMNATCNRLQQNMLTGLVDAPAWLEDKYMVVRYEDVALYPYEIAQSVYNFVGLSFPQNMLIWIANNTGIPIPPTVESSTSAAMNHAEADDDKARRKRAANRPSEKLLLLRRRRDPYGTSRDSAKTVQKWVNQLSYRTVRHVEHICDAFMKMAGYLPVGDEVSFQRNKSRKYFLNDIPLK